MKKRALFLLPIAFFALTGCTGNGGNNAPTTSQEEGPEEVVIPQVQDNDLKTAYDAAAALDKGGATASKLSFTGVVWGISGHSYFISKGYSGMYVYGGKNELPSGLEIGKTVTINSKLCNYSGCLETKDYVTADATVGAAATLDDEIKLCGAGQLAQLRQNIRVGLRLKVTVLPTAPWSDSNSPFIEGKAMNRDNEVADIKIKLDKFGYTAAAAAVVNAAQIGDVIELHNLVTTAYDSSEGSPVCNQLMACGATTAAVSQ